jgi:uncharacterized membrane protein
LVKRDSRFVSFHAVQVLLLQLLHIALLVLLIFGWGFMFLLFALTPESHVPSPFPFLLIPMLFLLWIGPWITIVVLGIAYGIKANQGEWAEYPVLGGWAKRLLHMKPETSKGDLLVGGR